MVSEIAHAAANGDIVCSDCLANLTAGEPHKWSCATLN